MSMRVLTAILLLSLFSCTHAPRGGVQEEGDSLYFKYAQNIRIEPRMGYTLVELADPWKTGRTLHQYCLVPRDAEVPHDLPKESTVIPVPVKRAILFTTVHCALVHELGRGESVVGVADLKYVKQPWVQEAVRKGRIADCGNGMNPDMERIIDARPEVLLLSPFENSGGYGKVEEIGVPIVECADYMEVSALARAEWMRFYGILFGAEREADSLFATVERNYLAIKNSAKNQERCPRVLMDKVTGSVWYVPGGRSTMAGLIRDAGGRYEFADDTHSGSVALSFETVLNRAQQADVWLIRTQGNLDLLREKAGYAEFRAYQGGNVWACDVAHTRFYEDTPFHPDILLREFYEIFSASHPKTHYFFRSVQ